MVFGWLTQRLIDAPHFKGRRHLIRLLLRLSHGRFVTSPYGVRMCVRAEDLTNQAAVARLFRRDYDDVYAEVAALEPGMAFIDIGANQGLFTLIAGKQVGADGVALAFEPDFEIFHILVQNIAENRLTNVFPFNAAISRKNGIENFQRGPRHHSGIGQLAPDGQGRVMAMNFMDHMPLFGALLAGRRTIVKIDVEGHEVHVIGALSPLLENRKVEKLIIEIDENNLARHGSTAAELYDALTAAGFVARRGQGTTRHYNEIFDRAGAVRLIKKISGARSAETVPG